MLCRIPRFADPNLLIGFDTSDDAGVYKLSEECALVQTLDFFTPIVDDPYTFGAIAAANSLSDVYAMGGKPITALSILCYPGTGDLDDLAEILKGGAEKIHEAGCALAGGHSVNDPEIKFGYSITGTIHPAKIKANSGARPGDVLLLTKPIGTGVIGTALKRGIASAEHVDAMIASMLRLNRDACDAMLAFDVHGCTDITGFGLIGHLRELAKASGVTVHLDPTQVRFLAGASDYAAQGAIPGGLNNNREFASPDVEGIAPDLLYDPQTSGGLCISMSPSDASRFEAAFPEAFRIGTVAVQGPKVITLQT